ncbi:MAG: vWA domain-containing protein [Longimicrobiales bacterium]
MTNRNLLAHLVTFVGALRARRVRVGLSDEVDAATALTLVDLLDRDDVRYALRTALRIRRRDWPVFDEEFRRLWLQGQTPVSPMPVPERATNSMPPAPRLRSGFDEFAPLGALTTEGEVPDGEHPGYSPDVLLRRKPFDQCTPHELAELERLMERMKLELATRPGRRLMPARARGYVDLRRSFRQAVATHGDFARLARRARAIEEPKLVLLCDTSGSMDAHSRFFLSFILALKRVARRTEAFAFNTKLTRLTPWLAPGKIRVTLDRLAAQVPDWSGGTRIGECLNEFVLHYQRSVIDADTIVIILSDGLDCGDPAVLAQAMRAIQARARRVIWLNPLKGDVRYEPLARGMAAALPFVGSFAAAHNLESLEAVAGIIALNR